MANKRLIHFRKIFYPFLAFLFGIIMARRILCVDVYAIITVVLTFCAITTGLFLFGKYKSLIILMLFFILGNGFYYIGTTINDCKSYQGQNIVVGRVTDTVKEYSNGVLVILDSVHIAGEDSKNISLFIVNDTSTDVQPGDKIVFTAEVVKVKLFELGKFNSEYIRNNIGYSAIINESQADIIGSHLKFDESLRLKIKNNLYKNLSEENAGICYAVLFGDKNQITGELKDAYSAAGIIHILSVSGLHITFLITLIYFVLRRCHLGRISTTIITSIILLLYNFVCGFSPSVVRASLMALIIMISKLTGRQYDNLNSLGLAGFIILLVNPFYAFDVGFQMSFFSVAAIFMLYPFIFNILKKLMNDKLAEYIAISLSAQIGILPCLASIFKTFNFLSFFANLLIIPLFGIVYPFLFVLSFLSIILGFLTKILPIFNVFFNFITSVADFFAGSALQVSLYPFDLIILILSFVLIFSFSRYFMLERIYKSLTFAMLSLALVVASIVGVLPIDNRSTIMTAVTSNNSFVMLKSRAGHNVIVCEDVNDYSVLTFCKNYKIKSIDAVFDYERPSDEMIDFYSGYSSKAIIMINGTGNGYIHQVNPNSIYEVGEFRFRYATFYGNNIALEIYFDNIKFCFAWKEKLGYNIREEFDNYVAINDYDFIYIDGEVLYKGGNGYKKKNAYRDGNYKYLLGNNKKFELRSID